LKVRIPQFLTPLVSTKPKQDARSLTRVRPKAPHATDSFEGQASPNSDVEPEEHFGPKLLLPTGLTNGRALRGNGPQDRAFRERVQSGQPISLENLPPNLLLKLESILEGPMKGLVQSPHPGMQKGVFDFAKLHNASPDQVMAVQSYLQPGFVHLPIADKAQTIADISGLLLPGGVRALQRFHLPQPFTPDSQAKPLTFAMEAEAGLLGRPETLLFYAPDPSGALDPRALTDDFLKSVQLTAKNQQVWLRLTPDQQREQLKWSALPLKERVRYLKLHKEHVDEKVALRRISNPKLTSGRTPLPKTLCDVLVWEGSPLRTAEIITEDHSPTMDTLMADVNAVAKIGKSQPGFHIHQVVELSTPEDVKRIGPAVTGLAALEDLRIFAHGVRRGSNLLTHTHLEVWQADAVDEVATSFKGGEINSDAIDIHKFHCVGMREGIYGDDKRLGIEIRAVLVGQNQQLAQVAQRTANTLAEGHLDKLPAPPWPDWNAGQEGLADTFYDAMVANPKLSELMAGADLSFSEVLEVSSGSNPTRDAWKFACPFWAFESLPGVTEAEAKTIKTARMDFARTLIDLSKNLSEACEAGRELDAAGNQAAVHTAASEFMQAARIDSILGRTLERVSEGLTP